MGTRNFYSANDTGLYAIEDQYTADQDPDGELFQDHVTDIELEVIELLSNVSNATVERDCGVPSDNNNSFGGHIFGQLDANANRFGSFVRVELVTRGGYYSGANIDYILHYISSDGDDCEAPEDIQNYIDGDYKDVTATEQKALEAQARRITKALHIYLSQATTPLVTLGVFSDGTAVYQQAGN